MTAFPNTIVPEHHRRDIDGLRAVAVIGVLLFHLWPEVFPGGHYGVDLFFVISGYLIAKQVMKQQRDGTFSFKVFWTKRVKRLFPALFVMLTITMIFGWFWRFPNDYAHQAAGGVAALFGVSNVFFFLQPQGYFDTDVTQHPYLHTWSLGVEEQFYLLFPIVVGLGWRWGGTKGVFMALWAVTFVSLLLAWETHNPNLLHHALWTRAWQLGAGAFLAWRMVYLMKDAEPTTAQQRTFFIHTLQTLVVTGFVCLCLFWEHGSARHNLIGSTIAVGMALIVLMAGNGQSPARQGWLGATPLLGIGLLSYGIYLWHQPIIVFARELHNPVLTPFEGLILVLMTTLVAAASYRWIEKPLRHVSWSPLRTTQALVGTLAMGTLALGSTVQNQGWPNRIPEQIGQVAQQIHYAHPIARHQCHLSLERHGSGAYRDVEMCLETPHPGGPRHWIFGDSHALSLSKAFWDVNTEHNFGTLHVSACLGIVFPLIPGHPDREACARIQAHILNTIKELASPQDTILWHNRWTEQADKTIGLFPNEHERHRFVVDVYERGLQTLVETGMKVILVDPVPEHHEDVSTALARHLFTGRGLASGLTTREEYLQRHALYLAFAERAEQHPQVTRIRLLDLFCPETQNTCLYQDEEGFSLYRDDDHLNERGSAFLFRNAIEPVLRNLR